MGMLNDCHISIFVRKYIILLVHMFLDEENIIPFAFLSLEVSHNISLKVRHSRRLEARHTCSISLEERHCISLEARHRI